MTPTIKVTYFAAAGRAEPIRLALHIGGIPFEDERIPGEEFPALKASGKLPFLSMPTMTVDDEIFAESGALLRFAGKLAGLYPKCDKAAMKVDMIVDALETVMTLAGSDSSKEGRAKLVEESFPRYIGAMDKIYSKTKGPYLLGESMTIADIKLMTLVTVANDSGKLEHLPAGCLEKYTYIMAATKAVLSNEKVQEWNASH